jgi:Spy/CpxP family protein refolding chaperone
MNTTKTNRFKSTITIALLAVFLGTPAFAHGDGGKDGKDFTEKKIERMTKELSLTPDQVAKIRPILESGAKEVKDVMTRTHEQVAAVLTDEQKAKLEAKKAEWKEKAGHRKEKRQHEEE